MNVQSKDYLKHLKQQHDNMKEDFPLFHWKMDTPLISNMQPQKWIWKMFSSLEMVFGVPCSIPVIPIFWNFRGSPEHPKILRFIILFPIKRCLFWSEFGAPFMGEPNPWGAYRRWRCLSNCDSGCGWSSPSVQWIVAGNGWKKHRQRWCFNDFQPGKCVDIPKKIEPWE